MKKKLENLNTNFIGKRIDYYEILDSTHLLAKKMSDKEIQNGMIILAENQISGIGTHGRIWKVESGKNLTFNIILTPHCDIQNISNLTIIIAECIVKTLYELYGIKTEVKIPNDIILNNKKLAGILTETVIMKEEVKKIFIGIGINVNQEKFPNELKNIATSLKKEFKKDFSKDEILQNFLQIFEIEYMKMLDNS